MAAPIIVIFRHLGYTLDCAIGAHRFHYLSKYAYNHQQMRHMCQRDFKLLTVKEQVCENLILHHNVSKKPLLQSREIVNIAPLSKAFFTSSVSQRSPQDDEDSSKLPPERPLHLMKFRELIWPHPVKTLRNWFLSFLIKGYMDRHFAPKVFLEGAEQAIAAVSSRISRGQFDELEGLVTRDAIQEIRQSYQLLNSRQKQLLAVNPKDVYFKFIYEIGMIFDDDTDKRFVEITTVFQGFKGVGMARERGEAPSMDEMDKTSENMYICNYRFIREYTKDIQESTDWTINKLNHFSPRDVVKNTDIFSR